MRARPAEARGGAARGQGRRGEGTPDEDRRGAEACGLEARYNTAICSCNTERGEGTHGEREHTWNEGNRGAGAPVTATWGGGGAEAWGAEAKGEGARNAETEARSHVRGSPPFVPLPSPFSRFDPFRGEPADFLTDVRGSSFRSQSSPVSVRLPSPSTDHSCEDTRGNGSWAGPADFQTSAPESSHCRFHSSPATVSLPSPFTTSFTGYGRAASAFKRPRDLSTKDVYPGSSCEWQGSSCECGGSSPESSNCEWPSAVRNPGRDSSAHSQQTGGGAAVGIHTDQVGQVSLKPYSARELVAHSHAALLSTQRPPRLRPVRALFQEE
jgi:hypothetical protein